MQEISIIEKKFDFEGFTKAILGSVKHFDADLSEDDSPDLLLGINSEGDILYLDKNDLYTTDNKLTVDVLRIKLKEGFSICFPFTNIFAEIEEKGHLTCADGKKYKIKMTTDGNDWCKFVDPDAPDYYDTGAYGLVLRWEKDKFIFCGGMRDSGDDGIEVWQKPWQEIDVPMEKFLRKFVKS